VLLEFWAKKFKMVNSVTVKLCYQGRVTMLTVCNRINSNRVDKQCSEEKKIFVRSKKKKTEKLKEDWKEFLFGEQFLTFCIAKCISNYRIIHIYKKCKQAIL